MAGTKDRKRLASSEQNREVVGWEVSLLNAYAERLAEKPLPPDAFTADDLAQKTNLSVYTCAEILRNDYRAGKLDRAQKRIERGKVYYYFGKK